MFVYNDAEFDARVWREASALAGEGFEVTIYGLLPDGSPRLVRRDGIDLVRVRPGHGVRPGIGAGYPSRPSILGRASWLTRYGRAFVGWRSNAVQQAGVALVNPGTRVWHGHDLTGLAAASLARRRFGGHLVYDSHELFMEDTTASRLPGLLRNAMASIEKHLSRQADAVITVNGLIAAELTRRYSIAPTVVMNCPPLAHPPIPRLTSPLRSVLGLGTRKVVLYHGQITPAKVRSSLEAVQHLDPDVALVLLGQNSMAGWLREWTGNPSLRGRIFVHPPVPTSDLPAWIAGADVGVVAFRAESLNYYLSAPNKLFECLNAGVPVVASDFPVLRKIVVSRDLGRLCDPEDPRSVALAVNALLSEGDAPREARRSRCRRAAVERYSWEHESERLLTLYRRLIASDAPPGST